MPSAKAAKRVVAHLDPLRWIKDEPPLLEEVLQTMQQRAARLNFGEDRATGPDAHRRCTASDASR